MVHRNLFAALAIGILLGPSATHAQAQAMTPVRVVASAPADSGQVHGFVRDAKGAGVPDARVLAVGQTVVAARSDTRGRFQMAVPPGDYILRATRDGYLSTYREPVRVQSRAALERTITLFREGDSAQVDKVADNHSHSDLAWQLRHLPRSVLRDGSNVGGVVGDGAVATPEPAAGRAGHSFLGRAVDSSLRFASLIADTDFTGQLNFVTTATALPGAFMSGDLPVPRNVAYLVLGAPAGRSGDWRVRGAVAPGGDRSWNFLGEYAAHSAEVHALRVGVSYSAQGAHVQSAGEWSRPSLEARSVAGVFAEDRWRALSGLEFEYGVRADRYDFLADPYLLSASGAAHVRFLPSTMLGVRFARTMLAPGAEEFLPPSAESPWLPPERTFSSFFARDPMRAETVRHVELGVTHEFGSADRSRALHVRALAQDTTDQIITMFGSSSGMEPGRYRVARAGAVAVSGWAAGVSGTLLPGVTGRLEYGRLLAAWNGATRTRGLRRLAPFVIRDDREWIHDFTASVDARFNEARTRVSVVYRADSAFADEDGAPSAGTRFDVQFNQALPYRPLPGSRLELMFAVRTLFREPGSVASLYDELLTVAPPLRLLGGIQVRF